MRLHDLQGAPGSRRPRRRVGRGIGSGLGKTSGRGQKGQGARSGGTKGPAFEGGQMPIHMRLPKRGFNNAAHSVRYATVNIRDLARFESGETVTPELLLERGILSKLKDGVKVLGEGELSVPLTVRAHRFSEAAAAKIAAAGGKAEVI